MTRRTSRSLALFVVLALFLSACASLSLKEKVVQSSQSTEVALGLLDDAERTLFASGTVPGWTAEKHRAFSAALSNAFADQIRVATAVRVWRAGEPVPADLNQLIKDVGDALTAVGQATAGTPAAALLDKIRKVLDAAAALSTLMGGK